MFSLLNDQIRKFDRFYSYIGPWSTFIEAQNKYLKKKVAKRKNQQKEKIKRVLSWYYLIIDYNIDKKKS